jgi:hypothetical protein
LKLSVQVHEVGHNLGLPHSGEGNNNYDDKSGMMVRHTVDASIFLINSKEVFPLMHSSFDDLAITTMHTGI